MDCYLNARVIGKIHRLQKLVEPAFVAQTNSRYNGKFLKAVRVYRNVKDKGRPKLAIARAYDEKGLDGLIERAESIRNQVLPSPAAVSSALDEAFSQEPTP